MPEPDPISIFITRLNDLGVKYIVTGSVASIVYGQPRLTHDVDLVIELGADDTIGFIAAFPPETFYCPPEEVIRVEIGRQHRGHFNLIHYKTGFKADVYLSGKDDLHRWALSGRNQVEYEGSSLWVAPIEYVILRKLQYYQEGRSDKHILDIQSMVQISDSLIDDGLLEHKIAELNLEAEWRKIKS